MLRSPPKPSSPLLSMFANTAWLLSGKGFGAVCSLLYLAILTRSLGLKAFGHFALIFGTSQALIALAGVPTWTIVVRYGAKHVHAGDWRAFGRLGMFAGLLDALGALCGCVIAYVAIIHFGDALNLNPSLVGIAFWFNVVALWAISSAPTGIVRALDRFDIGVYVEAIVPAARLAAAAVIWFVHPDLLLYLLAWATIDLVEAALYWWVAQRLCPTGISPRRLFEWRQMLRDNPGIGHFTAVAYLTSSFNAVVRRGPLLAIGYFVGTSAAGLYRLADQLAQGLSKLSVLLTRASYAEILRASVATDKTEFRRLTMQTTGIATVAGVMVVLLAVALGGTLLELMGGEPFRRGYVILIPLTLAAALDLASVAFEPVLHAAGRPRRALMARIAGFAALVTMVIVLDARSGAAIGWAVACGAAVTYVALSGMAWRALPRR